MSTIAASTDLVVFADGHMASVDFDVAVRHLHAHLSSSVERLGRGGADWRLVVTDTGVSEERTRVISRLVDDLDATVSASIDATLDRRGRRAAFADTGADVVAFLNLSPDTDLDDVLRPLAERAVRATVPRAAQDGWSRRGALAALGGAGLTALLAACGGSKAASPATSTSSPTTAAPTSGPTSTSPATIVSPSSVLAVPTSTTAKAQATPLAVEMTQGPYYLDLNLVRRDVREDRKGAALTLGLRVVDAAGQPIKGAAVDIWHCDADGTYSGFVSSSAASNGGGQGGPPPGGQGGPPPGGQAGAATPNDPSTFLRGTQLSDADGALSFVAVYPGWYQGRTVHIHVMVHAGGKIVHTGQLFFDDSFTDTLYASTTPYSTRGKRTTRNAADGIFGSGGQSSTLAVTKSADVYAAQMTVAVKTA